jgi:arsenate reductase
MKILFLCVANSARSQMAEGLAKSIFPESVEVESAGSVPSGIVNPWAVEAMKEADVDISTHHSKSYEQLSPSFQSGIDYVIALCAEEVCPVMIHPHAKKLKWPFKDPAAVEGTDAEKLAAFVMIRDEIKQRLIAFKSEIGCS